MRNIVKKLANWVLDTLPGTRYIVFESEPDLSDNTKAVFDEMLRRGLSQKYRFVWWVKDSKAGHPAYPGTRYIDRRTKWSQLAFSWITLRAKCLICCNKFLPRTRRSVKSFYLTHGTALKRLNGYYLPQGICCTLIASEHVREVMAAELKGDPDAFYALGYPRNDALQNADRDLTQCLGGAFRKVIVWYPTYRQHSNGLKTDSANALPILHDGQAARQLNEYARAHGVLIVVKPHFMQDISYIRDQKLSNIRIINDAFFQENAISSYEFVGSCDALVTDYSSIYFDYLLCDKPVAVVWEDIEDYRKNPGFAMDPDFYMKGAHKIYDLPDFMEFIRCVVEEDDLYRKERQEINALVNYATDGKNAERVVDFIVKQADL